MGYRLKRPLDILLSAMALLVFSPVLLAIALLVRVRMGSPVLFRQQRPGLHGRPFAILKFRTMTDARDRDGRLLPDADRLTALGRFLRRTSLDELPELINVLCGDMSLVGPRPLLAKYLPYYTEREMLRHDVRPGITGLAQVRGRNNLGWDERLKLDVTYVENCSLALDIKIVFITLLSILTSKDVVEVPRSTMLDLDEERSGQTVV